MFKTNHSHVGEARTTSSVGKTSVMRWRTRQINVWKCFLFLEFVLLDAVRDINKAAFCGGLLPNMSPYE